MISEMSVWRRHKVLGKIIPIILVLFIVLIYSHWKRKTKVRTILGCVDSAMSLENMQKKCFQGVLPPENELKKLTLKQLDFLYNSYVSSVQKKCNDIAEVGNGVSAGWNICEDDINAILSPCFVYSFGTNTDFDFLRDMAKTCEVHMYDESLETRPEDLPEDVHMHLFGVDEIKEVILYQNFDQLMHANGHGEKETTIALVKMERDAVEWTVLYKLLQSASIHFIKQLCFEFYIKWYYDYEPDAEKFVQALQLFHLFHEHGFRIISSKGDSSSRYKTKLGKERYGCQRICMVNVNVKVESFDVIL